MSQRTARAKPDVHDAAPVRPPNPAESLAALEQELAALSASSDPSSQGALLDRLLTRVRRLVRADGGSIYLRQSQSLQLVIVQNESLERQLGRQDLRERLQGLTVPVSPSTIAGYVALTGEIVNLPDLDSIPPDRPYSFSPALGRRTYRYRSMLTVPIAEGGQEPRGVLQVINAVDADGRVVAFGREAEAVVCRLARLAARLVDPSSAPNSPVLPASPGRPPDPAGRMRGQADRAEAGVPGVVARRPGEMLMDKGLITREQLGHALNEQRRSREKIGAILVRLGYATERQLLEALSEQYGMGMVELASVPSDAEALRLVPADFARKYSVLPIARDGKSLRVAVSDPTDLSTFDTLRFITGLNVVPLLASPKEILEAIQRAYQSAESLPEPLDDLQPGVGEIELVEGVEEPSVLDLSPSSVSADDTPIVRLVNRILVESIRRGASDVHIESLAQAFRVRLRIDGRLVPAMTLPKRVQAATVARIKVMAELDIAQHRLPQDGRLKLRYNGRSIDLRVSIIPAVFGESVNLRILDGAVLQPDLSQLGFDAWALAEFVRAIQKPHGVILITGPTGSGKTTTLYSAIHALSQRDLKILTIEDPVEYTLEGINQVHVQEEIGRTFAGTLRAFLRHDPDVILVGEMRDLETAQTAIRAGLTGHLVLSTLHTNDCASTIVRLLDMTIPAFLVAASLRLLVAQRLVRKLCAECREPYEVEEASLGPYGYTSEGAGKVVLYRPGGCAACNFTGMKGRVAIFEVMPITPVVSELILKQGSAAEIREVSRHHGMKTLREAGLRKAMDGTTTLEEVARTAAD